jgi:hypothetical protein
MRASDNIECDSEIDCYEVCTIGAVRVDAADMTCRKENCVRPHMLQPFFGTLIGQIQCLAARHQDLAIFAP